MIWGISISFGVNYIRARRRIVTWNLGRYPLLVCLDAVTAKIEISLRPNLYTGCYPSIFSYEVCEFSHMIQAS
jgi:hypothetical protein